MTKDCWRRNFEMTWLRIDELPCIVLKDPAPPADALSVKWEGRKMDRFATPKAKKFVLPDPKSAEWDDYHHVYKLWP